MSGLRPNELRLFYRRLHARGLSTTVIAEKVGRAPGTVSRVLNGSRRRGPLWNRIKGLLTAEEINLIHVAEGSAWNKMRVAMRPRWTLVKDRLLHAAKTGTERENENQPPPGRNLFGPGQEHEGS